MARILVVDDEQSMREMLSIALGRAGFDVIAAESRATAAAVLAKDAVDLVITDVRLPDGDGIEILRHVKAGSSDTPVIVMTAYGSTRDAVDAMKLGAHDYLLKPFDVDELKIVVRKALEQHDLREENRLLKAELRRHQGLDQMIGSSAAMQELFDLIRSVAPTGSTVLLAGESGTGKELAARAIHTLSKQAEGRFVSVNCGAMPENLLESELFGHVKGAFTDAHQNKKGLFEVADGGTLFLDEIGETPPSMQVKLLRALQERRIRRVGGTEEISVDVRILAATNRVLLDLVAEGLFREDLYYRLAVIPLDVPPLRARRDDIPVLADRFRRRFSEQMGKSIVGISDEAMECLLRHDWPGNVRELENVIERAIALEAGDRIGTERLRDLVGGAPRRARAGKSPGAGFQLDDYLGGEERRLLAEALESSGGDSKDAARLLGVSARSLRYLIQKHRKNAPSRFVGNDNS